MAYAFTFDASACSGCKACQEACKDKNHLPVGMLWRRVVEVSGGEWMAQNGAWESSVFAYNLSIACNHCVHPKCAGVCPTDAYIQREDGIVYIDPEKCMGCGYCAWACPYNAPRYDFDLGQMTKCNFCFDNIDAGLPPSCVAACPMRVLNFVEIDGGPWTVDHGQPFTVHGQWSELWSLPATEHPFPLPTLSRTEPHLAVKPHAAMGNDLEKKISNYEEIRPKRQKSEAPLVAFTLLVQMAVGMFWAAQWMTDSILSIPYLLIGACLGLGGFFSFAHLGAKRNAWRAPFHLKKSWLSREILSAGLFGASWLAGFVLPDMMWITSLLGVGLIYSMAKVYQLRPIPAWNTWRTMVGFFVTAALLGHAAMLIVFGAKSGGFAVLALLVAELALMLSAKSESRWSVTSLRAGLILTALGTGILLLASNPPGVWISPVLFLLIAAEEIVGRVLFYTVLEERPL